MASMKSSLGVTPLIWSVIMPSLNYMSMEYMAISFVDTVYSLNTEFL